MRDRGWCEGERFKFRQALCLNVVCICPISEIEMLTVFLEPAHVQSLEHKLFFPIFVHICDSMIVCEREGRIGKRECAVVALCWWFKEHGSRVGGHVIN